jgi:hypothetical protein
VKEQFMKKKSLFLGMLAMGLALTVVLSGCEKDPVKALQGTWVIDQRADSGLKAEALEFVFRGNDFLINELGNGVSNQVSSGQFSVTGDRLTLPQNGKTFSCTYALEGNTLTITGFENHPLIFQKKNAKEK